ncbi:MAG: SDR family NAD(P)-dependent oxidoreductase, partial [Mesobacillus sp.]|uniref:SDR family NAD(P)-dependent oxidoreductase n=1 Tax=Mesobacillus sp. TaxID=2675271 RepID=UPI003C489FAB
MLNENLEGKTVIITGANSGIGFEAAKTLAEKGAHVIMAARNIEKGQIAIDAILIENKNAHVELMQLDLADLNSVRAFADAFTARFNQ